MSKNCKYCVLLFQENDFDEKYVIEEMIIPCKDSTCIISDPKKEDD